MSGKNNPEIKRTKVLDKDDSELISCLGDKFRVSLQVGDTLNYHGRLNKGQSNEGFLVSVGQNPGKGDIKSITTSKINSFTNTNREDAIKLLKTMKKTKS